MLTSTDRILTTHAGSLPRPQGLVSLQIALSKGEHPDAAELAAAIEAATIEIIEKQAVAGIDIGNNGEQARESFFTYVQHRMSGFAGTSNRPTFQDMVRYPGWLKLKLAGYTEGVNLTAAPQAQGAVQYADRTALDAELAQFSRLQKPLLPRLHPALLPRPWRMFFTMTSTFTLTR